MYQTISVVHTRQSSLEAGERFYEEEKEKSIKTNTELCIGSKPYYCQCLL